VSWHFLKSLDYFLFYIPTLTQEEGTIIFFGLTSGGPYNYNGTQKWLRNFDQRLRGKNAYVKQIFEGLSNVAEEEKMKRRLNARIKYAKFLEDTVKEMAKEVQTRRSGEPQDLYDFLDKIQVRTIANDEILGFAKLFNDQLTLRNISIATLFSLPVDTVGVTSLPFEDSVSERQRKLEKEEEAKKHHSVESNKDVALEEIINATAAYAQQQLYKLSES
nr:LETM1 and EF-hand domain-containing protein 1, mitochondrial [Tanacetum cinerariifolium]